MKISQSLYLTAASIILSIIVLELVTRLLLGNPLTSNNAVNRVTLFEKGLNIKNVGSIFLYAPQKTIKTETYYLINSRVVKAYGYEINTNNLGLVQRRDIEPNQKSHLILGDSFTEGQGATPWFYKLESDNPDSEYQLINGGIMGTGIRQWQLLERLLTSDFGISVDRVTLVFITHDFHRNPWNFPPGAIKCLHTAICDDSKGGYFGFDFSAHKTRNMDTAVRELHRLRNTMDFVGHFKRSSKNLLKKSALFVNSYIAIKERINSEGAGSAFAANNRALGDLVERYAGSINFVHINTRTEAISGHWNAESKNLMERLSSRYPKVNYRECWLRLEHFHNDDGHPNHRGYAVLRKCVADAVADFR